MGTKRGLLRSIGPSVESSNKDVKDTPGSESKRSVGSAVPDRSKTLGQVKAVAQIRNVQPKVAPTALLLKSPIALRIYPV